MFGGLTVVVHQEPNMLRRKHTQHKKRRMITVKKDKRTQNDEKEVELHHHLDHLYKKTTTKQKYE